MLKLRTFQRSMKDRFMINYPGHFHKKMKIKVLLGWVNIFLDKHVNQPWDKCSNTIIPILLTGWLTNYCATHLIIGKRLPNQFQITRYQYHPNYVLDICNLNKLPTHLELWQSLTITGERCNKYHKESVFIYFLTMDMSAQLTTDSWHLW